VDWRDLDLFALYKRVAEIVVRAFET